MEYIGIRTARGGDGIAVKGGWRKLRLSCNERDRSLYKYRKNSNRKRCQLPSGVDGRK
jgi:hypothetical protein